MAFPSPAEECKDCSVEPGLPKTVVSPSDRSRSKVTLRTVGFPVIYVNAPMPVMARPTMSVCMVSVPSKVWIASRSTMCRMTW
jgi:hypothetical protein